MHEYIEKATSNLSLDEMVHFTMLYKKLRKQKKIAFLMWLFGGAFGFHRMYLGDYKRGVFMAVMTLLSLGLLGIVGAVDVINIPRLTYQANKELTLDLVKVVKSKTL